MNTSARIVIVVVVAALAVVAVVLGDRSKPDATAPAERAALPQLIELGSESCVPCQMMQPVLDELRGEYAGKLQVRFIDVKRDPEQGAAFDIRVMPTQVLLDASGREVFRHEGFFAKDDIVRAFAEHGVEL